MKDYSTQNIRNVAVVGHGKTGKTSILEAALFNSGANKRLGRVDDGTCMLDYETEETKRKMTISDSLAVIEWNNTKINFIDTPGYPDFVGEVLSGLSAVDIALIVVAAHHGVEVETEKAFNFCDELRLPRAFFINKMDREHANFEKCIEELQTKFGKKVVPLQLPIGAEDDFSGIVDITYLKDIPAELELEAEEYHSQMIEFAAEGDEEVMEKYLEEGELTDEEILKGLIFSIKNGLIYPVFVGSATQNIGMKELLDSIVEKFPYPDTTLKAINPKDNSEVERKISDSFSGQIFKTMVDPFVGRLSYIRIVSGDIKGDSTYNLYGINDGQERLSGIFTMQGKKQINIDVAHAGDIVVTAKLSAAKTGDTLCDKNSPVRFNPIHYPEPMLAMCVSASKKGEEDKIFSSINKQIDEDPTIALKKDPETKQSILYGVGEVHLDVLGDKIQRKFGVKMQLGEPKVAYREAIRKSVKVEGKHKKQSGGHGQYGHVWLELTPKKNDPANEFTETIFGGSVPRNFFPAVEKGTFETLNQGVIAGYPVVGVKVNLYDGSYHSVDSSEAAFKTATSIAIKKGVLSADPILLEPINEVTILTPDNYTGDIMGKLNSKRGKVLGMEPKGKGMTEVKALVPASELYKYATDLRSQTQGRGSYSIKFSHYDPMPDKLAEKIIEEYKASKEKD